MRNLNCKVLSGTDYDTTTGSAIDANQLVSASFHAYFGDSTAAGTFKLQASNDIYNARYNYPEGLFTPTNWVDIPNQSASVASGASKLLTIPNMSYRWIRAVYTPTAAGVQTIVPIADTSAAEQSTVSTVADTGVFESTTITCPAGADATQGDYWVLYNTTGDSMVAWLAIDGDNTPPTGAAYLAAAPHTKVAITSLDTDIQVAAAINFALASANGYDSVNNLDGTLTYTQVYFGACTAPATHNADDSGAGSFTVHRDAVGAASNLNSKYFVFDSAHDATGYYAWYNVGSAGVDPMVVGRTGIEIDVAASASANAVASASRTAIGTATSGDCTITGSTNHIIITNDAVGIATDTADGAAATGFGIVINTQGADSNLNNTYFLLQDANSVHKYYVWCNVDSNGTDPMIAGRTGVEIDITGGDSAATIGGYLATAIAALNGAASFSTAGTSTVTVTNLVAGPFVPMSDGLAPTHFTFAVTTGGSTTITVNLNALSL